MEKNIEHSQEGRPYFSDLLIEINNMRRQNESLRQALEEANKCILELKEQLNATQSVVN